jgi:hypothetical protein
VSGRPTPERVLAVLADYLDALQRHPSAEEMMPRIVTEDFETGFVDGFRWRGLEGLRDFLAARDGFFDERHQVRDVLALAPRSDDEVDMRTRLEFFLRRWEAPSPTSEEFTGFCVHSWILRRGPDAGRWRVAAQIVERFEDLNGNAALLFATPAEGLNR